MRSRAMNNGQAYLGLAVIALSIAGLFWWGFHFQVFGTVIDWAGRPIQYGGFFAWIVAGAFGAGYIYGGYRGGFRAAGYLFLVFVVAAAIGVARRRIG